MWWLVLLVESQSECSNLNVENCVFAYPSLETVYPVANISDPDTGAAIEGYKTYRLVINPILNTTRLGYLAGFLNSGLFIRKAFQVPEPPGVDYHGINSSVFSTNPNARYDSWLSWEAIDGTDPGSASLYLLFDNLTEWTIEDDYAPDEFFMMMIPGIEAALGRISLAQITSDATENTTLLRGHVGGRVLNNSEVVIGEEIMQWVVPLLTPSPSLSPSPLPAPLPGRTKIYLYANPINDLLPQRKALHTTFFKIFLPKKSASAKNFILSRLYVQIDPPTSTQRSLFLSAF